jgi:membrane fusion protein, gold/copper resistance efflux system
MSTKRIMAAALVVAMASGGAYVAMKKDDGVSQAGTGGSGAAAPAPKVVVAEVVTKQLVDSTDFTGSLAGVQSVELRPRIGGYIESADFPEGGLVKRGQILFQIDPRPFQAALDRAKADLRQAEERLALAQLKFDRGTKLMAERAISQSELDALTSDRAESQARVDSARAAVQSAELDLDYTRVRSPIDGRTGNALVTKGNLVSGGSAGATLLTTIVSVDPLHVYFDIDEPTYLRLVSASDAGRDKDGRVASRAVSVGLGNEEGHPRKARLDFLGNRVDPTTGTARARAILPNTDGRLSPGLFARVRLETGQPQETVLINDQAVGTDQRGRFVLTVTPANTVEYRPVTLGGTAEGLRVVRSGLRAGERVVLRGMARPGMAVTPEMVPMLEGKSQGEQVRVGEVQP